MRKVKKNFKAFEPITNEELKEIAGGSEVQPKGTPTILIPISLAACPTTKCASIVRSCKG